MSGKRLVFVTGNRMKAREAERILSKHGISIHVRKLETDEVQVKDPVRVAEHKAKEAFRVVGKPLIVEDTALHIESMNGYPGTMIKHFFDSIGPQGILDFVRGKDRSAEAVTVVAYCDSRGRVKTFRGSVKGRLSERLTRGYDFVWDVIFIPEGHDKTFAEMGMEEKNRISQRRKAFERFAEWYEKGADPC
jgi:XTP/dITP diphosphohydrolase